MNLPGPPYRPGQPFNYGYLFTFGDFLDLLERNTPDMPYAYAVQMFEDRFREGMFTLAEVFEDGTWCYRFVPPEERGMVPVRIVLYERGL